jgi:DNA-binding transcriptional LysR family regulator
MTMITQAGTVPTLLAASVGSASQGLELRHLRYFVAVADAGTFTHAAQRMYVAQPTLSQQIRRLEEIIGTALLHRRREGVRLTQAGAALLEDARTILSLLDHGLGRTRHAAGLGRPRLRFVMPAYLPESLAVEAASRLRSTAEAVGVGITWLETALDAEFSPIRQRRADAGLGWTDPATVDLPAALEVMHLGEFEPYAWVRDTHPAASRGVIALDELASLHVIREPRASAETYDRWLDVLRTHNPRFDFTDPPFRQSLAVTLAFAASGSQPAAVLTGPRQSTRAQAGPAQPGPATGAGTPGLVPVRVADGQLTATAGLVWNGDLPDQLQQLLFDTADGLDLDRGPVLEDLTAPGVRGGP